MYIHTYTYEIYTYKEVKFCLHQEKLRICKNIVNAYNVAEIFYLHKQYNEPEAFNFILL